MAENINISPDMINNLVNMLKNTNNSNKDSNSNVSNKSDSTASSNNKSEDSRGIFSNFGSNSNTNSSSSNIDLDTIMKIKSIMEALNKKNDPKSNLLYSLKPYLRKSKQAKLDQYVNILKITQVTELFNKKEGDK